ncbi:MAG: hypothetical protein JST30_04070 [Armatimonadetes bacterium]|nr:hypothetical protein [Armatimonadota bacterium]
MRTLVKAAVVGVLAIVLWAFKPVSAPDKPSTPDQPWITEPSEGSTVEAGITAFRGTAPKKSKLEVIENGRIVCVAWTKPDGSWSGRGKLFGGGKAEVFVKVVGGTAKQSPVRTFQVSGDATQTLTITNPTEDDEPLMPKVTLFRGTGRPDDVILVSFNGKALFKTKVRSDGIWTKTVKVPSPEKIEIRAESKAEGEIVFLKLLGVG